MNTHHDRTLSRSSLPRDDDESRTEDAGEPVSTLWHYTSLEAALKILESKKLWATDVRYMNDAREIQHGIEVFRNALEGARRKAGAGYPRRAMSRILDIVEARIGDPTAVTAQRAVFAFCLSEREDDLSQWRAYSGPGSGAAFGFDPTAIRRGIDGGFELIQCEYDHQRQFDIANRVLEGVVSEWIRSDLASDHIAREVSQRFGSLLLDCVVSFKHEAFRAEAEWRMVWRRRLTENVEAPEVRVGRGTLIPYRVIGIATDTGLTQWPISQCTIGPTPHPELGSLAMTAAVFRYVPPPFSLAVKVSATPYRSAV